VEKPPGCHPTRAPLASCSQLHKPFPEGNMRGARSCSPCHERAKSENRHTHLERRSGPGQTPIYPRYSSSRTSSVGVNVSVNTKTADRIEHACEHVFHHHSSFIVPFVVVVVIVRRLPSLGLHTKTCSIIVPYDEVDSLFFLLGLRRTNA